MDNDPNLTLWVALAAPFRDHETKQRPIKGGTIYYVTARTVMNRLDDVLGPAGWWDEYTPFEHSVICRLTIRLPDGPTLIKCDAGGCAGMADSGDDDKSAFSDALKRAAVKFGVGRYLYRDGVPSYAGPPPAATPRGHWGNTAYPGGPTLGKKVRPATGAELARFVARCTIDPGLEDWIHESCPYPVWPGLIEDWTAAQVDAAWSAIREHLKAIREGRGAP